MERSPQTSNVRYFLGSLLEFRRKFPEALLQNDEELEISPQCAPAMTELAMMRLRTFEPKLALPMATRTIELEPKSARVRFALGKSFFDLDRPHDSISELVDEKRLAPLSGLIRAALAQAFRQAGQMEAAKSEADAYLKLKDKEEVLGPLPEENSMTLQPWSRP